jgi:2-polyprenyl-3-methyl-5-hydroxy-6-metoxy-1,4-benzoquinol methylase
MSFNGYYKSEIARYGGNQEYVLAKAKEKKPLIERVIKFSKDGQILEAGSGSSANSIFLSNEGFDITAIDNDSKMILLAKELSKPFNKKPKILKKKIEDVEGKYAVVFSHGVLEHFSDDELIKILKKELELGAYVVFSVPSDFFREDQAINGDERFMPVKKWEDIISKSNAKIVEKFSYFYDPDNLKLRILKLIFKITGGILPIRKPYIGFVIRKNVHLA